MEDIANALAGICMESPESPGNFLEGIAKTVSAAKEAAEVATTISADAVSAVAASAASLVPTPSPQVTASSQQPVLAKQLSSANLSTPAAPHIRVISLENFRSMGEFPRCPDHVHLTQVCARVFDARLKVNAVTHKNNAGCMQRRRILHFFYFPQPLLDGRFVPTSCLSISFSSQVQHKATMLRPNGAGALTPIIC
jgi:hypothetical protein